SDPAPPRRGSSRAGRVRQPPPPCLAADWTRRDPLSSPFLVTGAADSEREPAHDAPPSDQIDVVVRFADEFCAATWSSHSPSWLDGDASFRLPTPANVGRVVRPRHEGKPRLRFAGPAMGSIDRFEQLY